MTVAVTVPGSLEAVVFDLDGVLIESEEIWDEVRERYVRERGGRYDDEAQRAMMGMSSTEWSRYIHEELGVAATPVEINADVVRLMEARYRERLPLVPGAVEAVREIAAAYPLAVASSSNRELIDAVLELSGLAHVVPRDRLVGGGDAGQARAGRLPRSRATARRPARTLPRSRGLAQRHPLGEGGRHARGRDPEPRYPPDPEALADADVVLETIAALTTELP